MKNPVTDDIIKIWHRQMTLQCGL